MLLVIPNIVCSRFRLQNLSKRHNPSLLGIITCGVLVRFIAVCFSLENRLMSAGRWFKKGNDYDATRMLQPFISHAAIFHIRIWISWDNRSSEPKRLGCAEHKKPLVPRVKRYSTNMVQNTYISSQVIEPLLTKESR